MSEPTAIDNKEIHFQLYSDVENFKELHKQLEDGELDCCLIDARLIPSTFVVQVAAYKAMKSKKLITKTLYSEILYNLSISKNIITSLKQFGANETTTHVLAVSFDNDVFNQIAGKVVDLKELETICQAADIQKAYKLSDIEVEFSLVDSVCNRIAIKDI